MSDESDLPQEESIDDFWAGMQCVYGIGTTTSLYENFLILVRALLAFPVSNADSDRCFSMIRKIDTEERTHLYRESIASLLCLKINIDDDCFSFEPHADLLKQNRSAVRKYNEEHGSY